MSFKFSEIEGIDAELAAKLDADSNITSAITAHIETSSTNRTEVSKGEFKAKMNAMDAKVKAAEDKLAAYSALGDPAELEVLKASKDKSPELQSKLEALNAQLGEKDKVIESLESDVKKKDADLQNHKLGTTITTAIDEYNAANPTVSVKQDMRDVVAMFAKDALRYDEGSNAFRVYNKAGEIVATDKGAATAVDWLSNLRNERPTMFNVPTGGGASGSTSSGSANKKFADMTEAERVTLYKADPAQYQKLRQGTE